MTMINYTHTFEAGTVRIYADGVLIIEQPHYPEGLVSVPIAELDAASVATSLIAPLPTE